MRIESERLRLRPFGPGDLDAFAALNADPEVMRFFPSTRTRLETDHMMAWANDRLAATGLGFLAAELRGTGEFVGMIGLSCFDEEFRQAIPGQPEVEVGWRLARAYWGLGLAPEGARACLDHAWNKADLGEVVAITYRGNMPSRRVMEKIGMTHDPRGDFAHPRLEAGEKLRPHVLYRIRNPYT